LIYFLLFICSICH